MSLSEGLRQKEAFEKGAALEANELKQRFKTLFFESPFDDPDSKKAHWFENELSKNRYADIIPFERSRVKLMPLERGGPDYINASNISVQIKADPPRLVRYIAAQGPMSNTIGDFWRMIKQKSIPVVVMLTNVMEDGREKCAQYWPDRGLKAKHDYLIVETMSEKTFSNYILREIEVYDEQSEMLRHRVYQFHFIDWPDHSVPQSSQQFYAFWRDVSYQHQRSTDAKHEPAPLLVHCSAGCGRTGVFVVVDACIQLIDLYYPAAVPLKDTKQKDLVMQTVDHLRKQRVGMVQTPEQLRFCYKVLSYYMELKSGRP